MDITFLSGKNQEKIVYKELPNNSKKFIIKNYNTKFWLTAILFVTLSFLLLNYKRYGENNGEFPLDRAFIIVGIIIGLILILLHEILHLIPYPKNDIKIIVFSFFKVYSFCAAPIEKSKFILSSLLPMLLGIIPMFVFLVFPVDYGQINAILWGMGSVGLVVCTSDFVEGVSAVFQVPKNNLIQSSSDGFYYFEK